MNALQLNKRITIQQKTITRDPDYGSEVVVWTNFTSGDGKIWAEVQDALPSKSEQISQGVRVATRPARVRIRYLEGITSDMRVIVHGSTDRTCEITGGPAEIGSRRGIELTIASYSS